VTISTPEPQQAALATANLLREDIYDEIIKSLLGKDWRAQYADQLGDLTLRIKQAISTGMSDGEGIAEIQRRVRDVIGVDTDRRHGPVGSAQRAGYRANFNRVQAITRTVVNQASNDGAIEAYKANADIIKGYQWLTANDERVCPQCRGLNGRVYDLNSFERPPAHINCRCAVVPVLYSDEALLATDAPKNTYTEWLDKAGARGYLTDFLAA
jgi:SPP1 gp7 family putative phage head morphogenesis protein